MKIMTVVGARPQFIKEAIVSREIKKKHIEVLVHTGQHFDYNMSECFFEELGISLPDYNLGISGGSHSQMTAKMIVALEEVMKKEKPDWVCLYGDTNSTLAAALTAAKLHIPIAHVEAGIRTHSMTNPEEINRVCTDHVSTLLFAATQSSVLEMKREGLSDRGVFTGDPMYDAFELYKDKKCLKDIRLKTFGSNDIALPDNYYYLTCHREENTNDDNLTEILDAMEELDASTVYPVHPRNRDRVLDICSNRKYKNIIFTEPVGYFESLCLVNNAKKIVTDSGGLQREAFFAGKQCVTILGFVCWPETMIGNRNQLAEANRKDILRKINDEQTVDNKYKPFGDGHAAEKIVYALENR